MVQFWLPPYSAFSRARRGSERLQGAAMAGRASHDACGRSSRRGSRGYAGRRMVLTKAVRATVLAAALALAGCGKQCEIKELHVDARQPIPVGQGVPVDAVIRFPPPEALYRWRAETGEFEPQESAASSTTYRARRPGVDRAMLEVVKRNVVNCEKTVEIRSVAASAGGP